MADPEPEPLTEEELDRVRTKQPATSDRSIVRGLIATIDRERSLREQAERKVRAAEAILGINERAHEARVKECMAAEARANTWQMKYEEQTEVLGSRLAAAEKVVEAAIEAWSECDLSPKHPEAGVGRRWCLNHHEWNYDNGTPCSFAELRAALDAYQEKGEWNGH